ncbi:MAG: hypothetical protein J5I91_07720 [Bacteroidetes bacterium]|nr:hypothetical protein [Bacteroidota bacterium]
MRIIVDCGSTKCDFLITESKKIIQCPGFNPNVSEDWVLEQNLKSNPELFSLLSNANEILYYGTGCAKAANKERVQSVLLKLFTQATVFVKHDLDLTLDALAKGEPCFVNIIGTGSNSLFFDGEKPIQLVPSLGYILGDEGSGTWFGKQILRDFFYRKLPKEIENRIVQKDNPILENIIEKVYRTEGSNRFIAGFTQYLSEFRNTEYTQHLLHKGFTAFLDAFIFASQKIDFPLHFSGSIAFYFADELRATLKQHGLVCGKIVKSALEEMA